jgi:hypothetical protein
MGELKCAGVTRLCDGRGTFRRWLPREFDNPPGISVTGRLTLRSAWTDVVDLLGSTGAEGFASPIFR